LQIKLVDISDPDESGGINPIACEILVHAEEMFDVPPEEQGLPMIVVGERALTGEGAIREQLAGLIGEYLRSGGTSCPDIPGLAEFAAGVGDSSPGSNEGEECGLDEDMCEAPAPVWVAYFYEVGCRECSRAEYDIRYVESKYPQVMVQEYNAQSDVASRPCIAARFGFVRGLDLKYTLSNPRRA
jgi:hypothetical protein